jgi:hypothetical protein
VGGGADNVEGVGGEGARALVELDPDDDDRLDTEVTVQAEVGHSEAGDLRVEVHPTPAAESTGGDRGGK